MFIAIPVGMNYRTERLPVVTFSLIGLNTLVFLVALVCQVCTDGKSQAWVYTHLWLVPGYCTWYAPFTCMFVHEGPIHLAGNMLFLFLFGSCVEDLIGRLRFTVFYLVGGLIADVVFIAMSPAHFHSHVPMGGASGAISACLGMYLLLRASAEIEFKYFLWFWTIVRAGEFEIPAWVAIIFWFGKDLFWAIMGMIFKLGGGVAFGAHVGGLLGGLALVGLYRWQAREPKEPTESEPVIDAAAMLAAARVSQAATPDTGETPAFFLHDGEKQTGPFTLTTVQTLLRRGEISRDASYWCKGMADWARVEDLAG